MCKIRGQASRPFIEFPASKSRASRSRIPTLESKNPQGFYMETEKSAGGVIKSIFNFQILVRLSFYKEMYWIALLYVSFRNM